MKHMDDSAFAKGFEDYIKNIDDLVRRYVKESDRFAQHRNGLLQKESSLSVLKSQNWDAKIKSSLNNVEEAIKAEFEETEAAKQSIDGQHSRLQLLEREVESQMKRLLDGHQKLRSCMRGVFLDDVKPVDNSVQPMMSMSDGNGEYASFEPPVENEKPLGMMYPDPLQDLKKPVDKNVIEAISKLVGDMSIRDQAKSGRQEISKENNLSRMLQQIKATENKDRASENIFEHMKYPGQRAMPEHMKSSQQNTMPPPIKVNDSATTGFLGF